MREFCEWAVLNVRMARVAPLIVASATIGFATPAQAAGTTAGTTISNTATASYNDPGGNPQTTTSNQVDILVDELLDVTVARADPGPVTVTPGSTNQVLSFTVTNTGNGSEAFRLTPTVNVTGDQFDPTGPAIVLDTNGNGTYDPGVDTAYTAGSNDPVLAPDASIRVFVLSSIPAGQTDGDRADVDLVAAAVTGTGAPGTSFPGAGQGGGAAVVGLTGADGQDRGAYIVQNASVSFAKSATVLDPFGGSRSVPGAVITYTLVATTSGTGTLANLRISDAVPANTTFVAGSITLQGASLTDATDADAGEIASNTVTVRFGTVAGGQTRTVTFRARIN